MLHLFMDQRPWFRAKSHGYGSGLPIAWQGWALIAMHVALIAGISMMLRDKSVMMTIAVVAAGLAPLPIYRAKTEGGWRWTMDARVEEKPTRKGRRK